MSRQAKVLLWEGRIAAWRHSGLSQRAWCAAEVTEATTGGGAGDRASEAGSPDASMLAEGRRRRCAQCGAVRGGLQPALVAAGDRASGSWTALFASFAGGVLGTLAHTEGHENCKSGCL